MNVDGALVSPDWTFHDVMERISQNGHGIAIVVDDVRRFLDVITDGDIRRFILHGDDLARPVGSVLQRERLEGRHTAVTALTGTPTAKLLSEMTELGIRHIPILDENGILVDVAVLAELVKLPEVPLSAVIMAGGFGSRLRPLTDDVPKAMLTVGDRPILERIIEQLRRSGVQRVQVSTHYKKEKISQHFGDGSQFGVNIGYLEEESPLGTAGALGLVDNWDGPLLVMNCDIVTNLDFRLLLDFHQQHDADMTVAVKELDVEVPYGVVETDGVLISAVTEKPVIQHFVSAGIYLIDASVRKHIAAGDRLEMPSLIQRLIEHGCRVVSFPMTEDWLDVGRPEDYERARREAGQENG